MEGRKLALAEIFLEVARRVDGAALVERALTVEPGLVPDGPLYVLAVGKVAFPMFSGLLATARPERIAGGLLVAPESCVPKESRLPASVVALAGDHPDPSDRSVAAGHAAHDLVAALSTSDPLLVLLSGGGSAALAMPAGTLSLDEKRATTKAVARAGATVSELNTVRKHLSAIKGGQLALATPATIAVLALSDVVGNDPGTIASGPFSPDSTTFAQALDIALRLAPGAPPRALAHLRRGAAGELPETPKPGDRRLARVEYRILAGPERVAEEARRAIEAAGRRVSGILSCNTERSVRELATTYGELARRQAASGGDERVFVGNGEPTIVVHGQGRGGRSTHLALLMAREIAGLPHVAFLAAGTDDRDGATDASGAVVDGTTWTRAEAAGIDPAAALERCDSEAPLRATGCLLRGPGTSNLLDLHLLAVGR